MKTPADITEKADREIRKELIRRIPDIDGELAATIVNDIHEGYTSRWGKKELAAAASWWACEHQRLFSEAMNSLTQMTLDVMESVKREQERLLALTEATK